MHLKDADGMKNNLDPDQTAPSDPGLHCLLRHAWLKTKGLSRYYGIRLSKFDSQGEILLILR